MSLHAEPPVLQGSSDRLDVARAAFRRAVESLNAARAELLTAQLHVTREAHHADARS